MNQANPNQTIPWQKNQEWQEIVFFFRTIGNVHKKRLAPVHALAREIQGLLDELSAPVEHLCSLTCPDCRDICCERATIWYDFKDLVYLYFGLGILPEKQIKKVQGPKRPQCSNLTKTGCCLPRRKRPFVCTWYFCPDQTRTPQYRNTPFSTKIEEIKELRNKLEEAFCQLPPFE